MRMSLIAASILFTVFIACSGSGNGSRLEASPGPGTTSDGSMQEMLLRLGRGKCNLRPNTTGAPWVLEFQKDVRDKPLDVILVGPDFVRLSNGTLSFSIPFHQILMVVADD